MKYTLTPLSNKDISFIITEDSYQLLVMIGDWYVNKYSNGDRILKINNEEYIVKLNITTVDLSNLPVTKQDLYVTCNY